MFQFSPPVRVVLGKLGSVTFNVTTPERAAEILLTEWPVERGSKHLAARKAVLKALETALDAKAVQRARKAFEAAADEAGILMPEPPKSEARARFRTPDWNRPKKPLKRDR